MVDYVVDGDTLHVRPLKGGAVRHVRLDALDAPEICQLWGPQARQALQQRVLHQRVQVSSRARDVYGRQIARVRLKGEDVGAWLVAQGHAWSSGRHRRKGGYAAQEALARAQSRGLFATGLAQSPADFRRQHGSCYAAR